MFQPVLNPTMTSAFLRMKQIGNYHTRPQTSDVKARDEIVLRVGLLWQLRHHLETSRVGRTQQLTKKCEPNQKQPKILFLYRAIMLDLSGAAYGRPSLTLFPFI
jgi:hypothetical protein